jgi:hypothetical protein
MNKQADIRLLQQNITSPDAHVWIVDRLFSTRLCSSLNFYFYFCFSRSGLPPADYWLFIYSFPPFLIGVSMIIPTLKLFAVLIR